ncbi:MAG: anhydro-N-acetylmuramic acid kinase [Planctomycetota bacterium]
MTRGSPWQALASLAGRSELLVAGLMSGTSGDGIDIALVRIRPDECGPWQADLETFESRPYEPALRERLLDPLRLSSREIAELGVSWAERAATGIQEALAEAGLEPGELDLIGSHGHTLWHQPPGVAAVAASFQIGEADVLAERLGVPVVSDFRPRDLAAGGQGAPLVPMAEWLLRRPETGARLFLNLGGMANVSVISTRQEDVLAFDTGPGVAWIDAAARLASDGREPFDRDGQRAARGRVQEHVLASWLEDPYFQTPPPKSTGRERFGEAAFEDIAEAWTGRADDLVRTLTELTARSIALSIERFVPRSPEPRELWISGGGAHHPVLVDSIRDQVALPVSVIDDPLLTVDSKEAVAFAILAVRTLRGEPGNVPSATGARRPVVLGKISLGL